MMGKKISLLIMIFGLILLAACGQNNDDATSDADTEDQEALKTLNVAFEVPETADLNEDVTLKAIVTYGDEEVVDADDVEFEYWLAGHEDNSTMLDAENNEDGTYTQTVSFDQDGEYEIYAHVTARDLHTMPKKAITVGNGASENTDSDKD